MHARKTIIKGDPATAAKAKEVIEGRVIPTVQDLEGFQGGYWLLDRETGDSLSFTFFDSADSLRSTSDRANQLRTQASGEIGATVQGVEEYEVGLDTGQKVHRNATHARVLHGEGAPDDIERGLDNIRERVIPAAQQLDGFLGGFWLVDRQAGKFVGVTLFDSAEHLAASREPANQIRERSSQSMPARLGEFKEYEIVAKAETPQRAGATS